ncbi:MAG: DUF177 domain-containing protein [Faecalimonas sp.]|nr:DUF177 domain-containing protein [Faecalimonas sp.]
MLIDLSDVLSEHHKTLDCHIPVELTVFQNTWGSFPIIEKEEMHLVVEHVKEREISIQGCTNLVLEIPCDRCLEPVHVPFALQFTKNVDLQESEDVQRDELDEKNYIEGYHLDVDQLLCNEILVGWPMKILCSEDCKGICNVCGQNQNTGSCNCEDTSLDPRMSVIRDVFKNFKEV